MNVFILDRNMMKSAQMLDDSHLRAQINEICQILTANYNKAHWPDAKIGHVYHPVTEFYDNNQGVVELVNYGAELVDEYKHRFGKCHQDYFFIDGFVLHWANEKFTPEFLDDFSLAKTYVNGAMTNDIEEIRNYIMTKPHTKPYTWTNRKKPDWWVIE